MGQQEVEPDFGYHNAGHVLQLFGDTVQRNFFAFDVDLVFAQVLNVETLLVDVPVNLSVFLAQSSRLCEVEIGFVIVIPLFAPNIKADVSVVLSSDQVLPSVLNNELAE